MSLGAKTDRDYNDGRSSTQEKKPDPEISTANENSDIEADRDPEKPPDELPLPKSPRKTPGLSRQRAWKGKMPTRALSTESDDVEYLTPEAVCGILIFCLDVVFYF